VRRRLTVAILVLVAATLLVSSLVSFLLVRNAAATSAERQLSTQARALAGYLAAHPAAVANASAQTGRRLRFLFLVRLGGQFSSLGVVGVTRGGALDTSPPSTLSGAALPAAQLAAGNAVTGHYRGQVFALVPFTLTPAAKARLGLAPDDTAVLVATRTVVIPVNGIGFFMVVALVALAAAAVVAAVLARRVTRPLVEAVDTTRRIAAGDLEARIPVRPRDVPELDALAVSINSMGESLERARAQQRQFLLSVSHDLRTPLTSIRGYADAIADGTADDVPAALEVISAEARRLDRLVGDLLDLARLDARRFSLEMAPVDVGDLVARAVEGFGPDATARSLELSTTLPADGTWVVTDGDRLRQVLSNLIENAFKFARHHVAVGARGDPGAVVLWVVDDGPGIAPDDLPRVFEPHFRSDRSGSGRSGTGLGLAIVAELAAAMGGGVWAESPVSATGGTRMVVQIPVAAPALATPAR